MVSDFINEHNRFLSQTDEEYEHAKQVNTSAKKFEHRFLEYGENGGGGYWTRDKFIAQINCPALRRWQN